jgi:hypothetical protein
MAEFASSQSFQQRYWLIAALTTSSVERPRDAALCLNTASTDGDNDTVILGILMCSLALSSPQVPSERLGAPLRCAADYMGRFLRRQEV